MRWLLFWRPPCLLRRVIVNFKHTDSEAIEGIVWQQRGAWFILHDCTAIKAGQKPEKLPDDVHIPRANIAYLQVSA